MKRVIHVGDVPVGAEKLTVVAGPCSLESLELGLQIGRTVRDICRELGLNYVFKASFDKANRTSIHSYRGPGMEKGLEILAAIREDLKVPVLTDIHEPVQAQSVSRVVDVLQIPAFLCRQTDLIVAAAETGKPLNVKKAQFLAPEKMASVVEKCREAGNDQVILCERGTSFGYNQLVVDMRSLPIMRAMDCPVMFDATHSVQMPGAQGSTTGGDRRFILPLARAAVSTGIDALFLETHPDPEKARSDGPNMVPLDLMGKVLGQVARLDRAVRDDLGPASLDWTEGRA